MKTMVNIPDIRAGDILTDLTGKGWKLGAILGQGSFGQIHLVTDNLSANTTSDSQYVVKIESYTNGPLFVEINCYLRIAKLDHIHRWKHQRHLRHLGMPHYIASGTHITHDNKYRFLIIPRYNNDLDTVLNSYGCRFNLKTVLTILLQLLHILEYIHEHGYVHSDIKAANIVLNRHKNGLKDALLGRQIVCVRREGNLCNNIRTCRLKNLICQRNLRPNNTIQYVDQLDSDKSEVRICKSKQQQCGDVVLLDFGLASKYLASNGAHKSCCSDERKAHAGTVLFCSLDAHIGVQSRRSDLESLGYNAIYWLTQKLPWADNTDLNHVQRLKQRSLANLDEFFSTSFGTTSYPQFLYDYFAYLARLESDSQPDYDYLRRLCVAALRDYGLPNDNVLDFGDLYNKAVSSRGKAENARVKMRSPLKSNVTVKPKTRKKTKVRQMNWSRILIDPEVVFKKARDRRLVVSSDNVVGIANMDLQRLNPTPAMLEVYKKFQGNGGLNNIAAKHKGDGFWSDHIDGYTSAMMSVHHRIQERNLIQTTLNQIISNKPTNKPRKSKSTTSPQITITPSRKTKKSSAMYVALSEPAIMKRYDRKSQRMCNKSIENSAVKMSKRKRRISGCLKRAVTRNVVNSRQLRSCGLVR